MACYLKGTCRKQKKVKENQTGIIGVCFVYHDVNAKTFSKNLGNGVKNNNKFVCFDVIWCIVCYICSESASRGCNSQNAAKLMYIQPVPP